MNKQINYRLLKDEVRSALYLINVLKNRKVKTIVEIAICAVLFIISLINVIVQPDYKVGYIIMIAVVIVILAVLIVPKIEEKHIVDNAFDSVNAEITLSWQDDENPQLRIQVIQTGADWQIDSHNIKAVKEDGNLTVILINNSKMVIVPKRVFDDEQLGDFNKVIESLY